MVTVESFTPIDPDSSGCPRFLTHFTNLMTDHDKRLGLQPNVQYRICCKRAHEVGGRRQQTWGPGWGIAFSTHSLAETCEAVNQLLARVQELQAQGSHGRIVDDKGTVVGHIRGEEDYGYYVEIEAWTDADGRRIQNQMKTRIRMTEGHNFTTVQNAMKEVYRRGYHMLKD